MRWYLGSSIFCEASPTIIQAWKKKIILFSYFISIYIKKLLPLIFISTLLMPFTPFCSFNDIIFDMKSTKFFSFFSSLLSIVQVSFCHLRRWLGGALGAIVYSCVSSGKKERSVPDVLAFSLGQNYFHFSLLGLNKEVKRSSILDLQLTG